METTLSCGCLQKETKFEHGNVLYLDINDGLECYRDLQMKIVLIIIIMESRGIRVWWINKQFKGFY